jgi:hypothetical protein
MWARVVEFMIACWLAMSPFIFSHPPEQTELWANDFTCSILVALFALFSFWDPLRKIHLLTLGAAFWLCWLGYSTFPIPASKALQNDLVVGIILLMLAIIPSHSEQPSRSWREFYENSKK